MHRVQENGTRAGLYSSSAYYMAQLAVYMPMYLLTGLLFAAVWYALVGLRPEWWALAWHCAICVVFNTVSMAIMHACILITSSQARNRSRLVSCEPPPPRH